MDAAGKALIGNPGTRVARFGRALLLFAGLAGSLPAALADGPRVLSDSELDRIAAGTAGSADGLSAELDFIRTTRSGTRVAADGSLQVVQAADRLTAGGLWLSGGAQSNLRSLINVNAVNSEVNILLNLNISIDSSIGTLNQLNLNGRVAGPPPR